MHHFYRLFLFLTVVNWVACRSASVITPDTDTEQSIAALIANHPSLQDHFVGFVLQDDAGRELVNINGDMRFTPASNMKIYTLYASLSMHQGSMKALDYRTSGDSLIIRGTGDPSLLGRFDLDSMVYDFLRDHPGDIYLVDQTVPRFGSGWAWDDYAYYYQKELSALPIYDNAVWVSRDSMGVFRYSEYASAWITQDTLSHSRINRGELDNEYVINPNKVDTGRIHEAPFFHHDTVKYELLSRALNRPVYKLSEPDNKEYNALYHNPLDTLYKALMIESDNYIAEQLMINLALSDTSYTDYRQLMHEVVDSVWQNLPGDLRWVDGSGLSRYNLVSPRQTIWVLQQISRIWTDEQIKTYFPHDDAGTLGTAFRMPAGGQLDEPFVYAKTGTLSNNHNLSGYIYTRSGSRLIFSFMNNHYTCPKSDIVKAMHDVLSEVYWQM